MREKRSEHRSPIGYQDPASSPCDEGCRTLLRRKLPVVTSIDETGRAIVRQRNIDTLLAVLERRSRRLVASRETRERLRPGLRRFVCNIVTYFDDRKLLDDVQLSSIMAALVTADDHNRAPQGVVDHSTFIRILNPTDPESDEYFIIGRAGKLSDAACPLSELEGHQGGLPRIPRSQLHMFRAFHFSRSMDATKGAPRIPVGDFLRLVPEEVKSDPVLGEAFMDVCFSDGAWELYQLRQAA
jgi:hypothetical protein